jgi:hypothetical protein
VNNTDTGNKTITLDVSGTANTYVLDDKYIIAGGISIIDIKGYGVDVYRNKDTGKVVFVEQSTTTTSKKGDIRAVGPDYFYLYDDTTQYKFGTVTVGVVAMLNGTIVRNGVTVMTPGTHTFVNSAAPNIDLAVDDTATFFIGADGNVSYVSDRGYDWKRTVVSDIYTAGTPYSLTVRRISSGAFRTDTVTVGSECKIEMNNADAKITDIKKGDIVSIALDPNNSTTANIVNASNKIVSGKITAKRQTEAEDGTRLYVSIDGVEYRLEGTSEVKDSDLYVAAAPWHALVKVGQTVNATLSQRNRVRVLEFVTGIADMGKIKRFVVNTAGSYDSWVMDMKGTEATYEVTKDASGSSKHTWLKAKANVGDFVNLTFDADGRISDVEKLVIISPATTFLLGDVYSGDKIVTINGVAYLVTNDTLLYVNDAPGSMSSVTKDARAAVAFSTNSVKLRALIVDTFAKMDTSSMAVRIEGSTWILRGFDKAAEPFSTIEAFNGTNFLAANKLGQGSADDAAGTVTGWIGGFNVPLTAGALMPASGQYVYVRVTDKFGNITSGPVRVP